MAEQSPRSHRARLPQRLLLPLCLLALAVSPPTAGAAGVLPVATVHTIRGGLTVLPPRVRPQPGRVNEPLFSAYGLRTEVHQKASIHLADRSTLFINQFTDLILQSPRVTTLRHGEVVVTDVPGARHRVITPTALAAATGTLFDVFITPRSAARTPRVLRETTKTFPPGTTTVSVVTGTVIVSNRFGRVRVLPGNWTHVAPGTAPTPPTRHHARLDVAWRTPLLP